MIQYLITLVSVSSFLTVISCKLVERFPNAFFRMHGWLTTINILPKVAPHDILFLRTGVSRENLLAVPGFGVSDGESSGATTPGSLSPTPDRSPNLSRSGIVLLVLNWRINSEMKLLYKNLTTHCPRIWRFESLNKCNVKGMFQGKNLKYVCWR